MSSAKAWVCSASNGQVAESQRTGCAHAGTKTLAELSHGLNFTVGPRIDFRSHNLERAVKGAVARLSVGGVEPVVAAKHELRTVEGQFLVKALFCRSGGDEEPRDRVAPTLCGWSEGVLTGAPGQSKATVGIVEAHITLVGDEQHARSIRHMGVIGDIEKDFVEDILLNPLVK